MRTTTIAVKEETKKELLKIAADLQRKFGRKVDYDEAIRYLLMQVQKKRKSSHLLREALISGLDAEKIIKELWEERRKDDPDFK